MNTIDDAALIEALRDKGVEPTFADALKGQLQMTATRSGHIDRGDASKPQKFDRELLTMTCASGDFAQAQTALAAKFKPPPARVPSNGRASRLRSTATGVKVAAILEVQEAAVLAEKVTNGADRSILHTAGEIEVVQHAADVLSLLLRDMGHQPRERLEHMLMAARR